MPKILDTPLKSITDLKKSPMKVFEEAKSKQTGVYILNNNQKKAVVIDVDQYEKMVMNTNDLADRNLFLETELRLLKNKRTYSDEEVRGKKSKNLSDVEDEWI